MARRRGRRGGKQVRERSRAKRSSRVTRLVAQEFAGAEVPHSFDVTSFFEGLRSSIWLAACCYRLSYAIASVGFQVKRRSDMTEAKGRNATRVRDLLERINEEETYFDWLEQKMVHLSIAGETYTEKVRNRLGETSQLFEWNPEHVTPLPDQSGRTRVRAYRFRLPGGGQVDLPREDVIPVRVYNPSSPFRGFSLVSPMKTDLSADIKAAKWNRSYLNRGANMSGFLKPENGDLGDDEWRRVKAEFQRLYSGAELAGGLAVLPAGLGFQETGTNPKDLKWGELRRWVREVASGGTGTPPILIGNFDAASYANTEQQLRAFWDYVGKPWLRKIWAGVNEFLIHTEIDEALIVEPDYLQIDSLIDSETTRVQNTNTLVQAGIMTINEARQQHGLPPLEDGDRLLLPLALDPVDPSDLERDPEPADDEGGSSSSDDDGDEGEDDDEDRERMLVKRRERRARETMRAAHAATLADQEKVIEQAAARYLRDSRLRFEARLRTAPDQVDADQVAGNLEAESRAAFDLLSPAFLQVVEAGADDALEKLGLSKDGCAKYRRKVDAPEMVPAIIDIVGRFDDLNPRVLAYLEVLFGHIEDLTRDTISQVRGVITDGLEKGLGVHEMVEGIRELGGFSLARAERIARTETAAALNLGVNEAFRAADTARKSWLSAKDDRRRPSHRDAEAKYAREPIPIGTRFVLEEEGRGVAELMFPADPEGPAWAVVNCRCAMVPEQSAQRSYWIARCKEQLAGCPST